MTIMIHDPSTEPVFTVLMPDRFTTVVQGPSDVHSDVGHLTAPDHVTTMCGLGLEHTRNFMRYERHVPCSYCAGHAWQMSTPTS